MAVASPEGVRSVRKPPPLELAEKAAEAEPINAGPVPARAVVSAAEIHERFEIAPVGLHRVRRLLLLVGEMAEKLGQLGRTSGQAVRRSARRHKPLIQERRSVRARSASRSFFSSFGILPRFRPSAIPLSSGSSSPKLAFIGWKCVGSASRR